MQYITEKIFHQICFIIILQDSTLNQEIYDIIGTNRILLHTGYELQYVKE
jgi:hypothetical protein